MYKWNPRSWRHLCVYHFPFSLTSLFPVLCPPRHQHGAARFSPSWKTSPLMETRLQQSRCQQYGATCAEFSNPWNRSFMSFENMYIKKWIKRSCRERHGDWGTHSCKMKLTTPHSKAIYYPMRPLKDILLHFDGTVFVKRFLPFFFLLWASHFAKRYRSPRWRNNSLFCFEENLALFLSA